MKKLLVYGLAFWMGAMNVNVWAEETAAKAPAPTPVPVAATEPEPETSIINNRYEIMNNGTEIRDLQTTLVWQRCSVGQTWGGTRCEGQSKELTFDDAQRLSNTEWRVPTTDELATLITTVADPKLRKINNKAFPGTEGWFWTADTPEPESLVASFINFFNGQTFSSRKINGNHVYLMRTNGVKYAN